MDGWMDSIYFYHLCCASFDFGKIYLVASIIHNLWHEQLDSNAMMLIFRPQVSLIRDFQFCKFTRRSCHFNKMYASLSILLLPFLLHTTRAILSPDCTFAALLLGKPLDVIFNSNCCDLVSVHNFTMDDTSLVKHGGFPYGFSVNQYGVQCNNGKIVNLFEYCWLQDCRLHQCWPQKFGGGVVNLD